MIINRKDVMNKIFFLCSFLGCLYSCTSVNHLSDSISIEWSYDNADSLTLFKDDAVLVPSMPVGETKQLHLNGFERGRYKILIYDNSQVVEYKTFSLR